MSCDNMQSNIPSEILHRFDANINKPASMRVHTTHVYNKAIPYIKF